MLMRFTGGLLLAGSVVAAVVLPNSTARGAGAIGNPVAGNLGFGVITEGDTTLGSTESEGPIAVGGNLTFGPNYNVSAHTPGTYTAPGDSRPTALLVAGRIDTADSDPNGVLRVLSQGYAKVGDMSGVRALNVDGNGAAVNTQVVRTGSAYNSTPRIELTARQDPSSVGPATSPIDFPALFAQYRLRAQEIADCPENVTLDDASGQPLPQQSDLPVNTRAYITLTPGITNVLTLTAVDLNRISELTFRTPPNASTPFVVVVTGNLTRPGLVNIATRNWFTPNTPGVSGSEAPYMLWDFPTATDITITGGDSLEGTLFAPSATVTDLSPSNIEGDIVAKSLLAGPKTSTGHWPNAGEIHYFPFAAQLTCVTPTPTPVEPTTTPTMTSAPPGPTSTSETPTSAAPTPTTPGPTPTTPGPTPTTPGPTPTTPGPTPTTTTPVPAPTQPLPSPSGPGPQLADTGARATTVLMAGLAAATLVVTGTVLTASRKRGHGRRNH